MPIVPFLLAAFIAVPLAEIALFIELGGRIGVGWTLALIVLTAVIGTMMLRQQGFVVLTRARRALEHDRVPVVEVFEGLCLLVAGALLLTPGFLTDAVGALLLIPPVRTWLYGLVSVQIERRIAAEAARRGRQPGAPPPTIDAEFEEIEPEPPDRQEPSDPDRHMPPPRGGWDRQ